MTRARLALAWPTFRRPDALREHFARLRDEASRLGVPLYVSDDSPDDATEQVVRQAAAQGPPVFYRRNTPALGHDRNLAATLTWPDADYVWLLGDKVRPKPGILAAMLDFLDDQDLVFVDRNAGDPRRLPCVRDDAARALVRDKLWHQTFTAATLYHRRVRDRVPGLRLWRNFPQVSLILDCAGRDPVAVGWFGVPSLDAAPIFSSYWTRTAVDVFVDDWTDVVSAFPGVVPPGERARVIRSHSQRSHLFSAAMLMELKGVGQFGWASLRRARFRQAMHLPVWKLLVLLVVPRPVFGAVQALRGKHKGF